MYRLTPRRFEKAKPILKKYRELLHRLGPTKAGFDLAANLEVELRACWNIGYQELKNIIIELSKRDYYRYLAAHYMDHPVGPGVVCEFQSPLAELYGMKSYNPDPDCEERKAFWQSMPRD